MAVNSGRSSLCNQRRLRTRRSSARALCNLPTDFKRCPPFNRRAKESQSSLSAKKRPAAVKIDHDPEHLDIQITVLVFGAPKPGNASVLSSAFRAANGSAILKRHGNKIITFGTSCSKPVLRRRTDVPSALMIRPPCSSNCFR